MAVGIVGGVTRLHPIATLFLKMLRVEHAQDLAQICVAVGLVQNLGALKALSTVGISKGHMKLHTANLALAAGALSDEMDAVKGLLSQALQLNKKITLSDAKTILLGLRAKKNAA